MCAISERVQQLMNLRPAHSIRSRQSTRSGSTQTKHSREEPIQIRSRVVAREYKKWRWARSARRGSSVGSLESHNHCCSESQANVLNHAHRRVACMLSRESSETCAGTLTVWRTEWTPTLENLGYWERTCTRDAASGWERHWQEHLKSRRYQLETQFAESVSS